MAIPGERLDSYNGKGANDRLMALRAAKREKEAMDQQGTALSLQIVALKNSGVVPPDISREIIHDFSRKVPEDEDPQTPEQEDPVLH